MLPRSTVIKIQKRCIESYEAKQVQRPNNETVSTIE